MSCDHFLDPTHPTLRPCRPPLRRRPSLALGLAVVSWVANGCGRVDESYQQAAALAKGGKPSEAIEALDRQLRELPDHPPSLKLRADLRIQQSEYEQALNDLDRLFEVGFGDIALRHRRAMVKQHLWRHDAAVAELHEVLAEDPENQLARVDLVRSYVVLQDWDAATRLLADERIAHDELFYRLRGRLHAGRGEHALAIDDFTEALRLNPQSAAAYKERSRSRRGAGQDGAG